MEREKGNERRRWRWRWRRGRKEWIKKSDEELGGGRNKTGYTATSVACGWTGAVIELLEHLGKSAKI